MVFNVTQIQHSYKTSNYIFIIYGDLDLLSGLLTIELSLPNKVEVVKT